MGTNEREALQYNQQAGICMALMKGRWGTLWERSTGERAGEGEKNRGHDSHWHIAFFSDGVSRGVMAVLGWLDSLRTDVSCCTRSSTISYRRARAVE